MEETNDGVPQPAVGQRLLVPRARTLKHTNATIQRSQPDSGQTAASSANCQSLETQNGPWRGSAEPELITYLDVLSQAVEDLLGYSHRFGEIPLAGFVNDVFP